MECFLKTSMVFLLVGSIFIFSLFLAEAKDSFYFRGGSDNLMRIEKVPAYLQPKITFSHTKITGRLRWKKTKRVTETANFRFIEVMGGNYYTQYISSEIITNVTNFNISTNITVNDE